MIAISGYSSSLHSLAHNVPLSVALVDVGRIYQLSPSHYWRLPPSSTPSLPVLPPFQFFSSLPVLPPFQFFSSLPVLPPALLVLPPPFQFYPLPPSADPSPQFYPLPPSSAPLPILLLPPSSAPSPPSVSPSPQFYPLPPSADPSPMQFYPLPPSSAPLPILLLPTISAPSPPSVSPSPQFYPLPPSSAPLPILLLPTSSAPSPPSVAPPSQCWFLPPSSAPLPPVLIPHFKFCRLHSNIAFCFAGNDVWLEGHSDMWHTCDLYLHGPWRRLPQPRQACQSEVTAILALKPLSLGSELLIKMSASPTAQRSHGDGMPLPWEPRRYAPSPHFGTVQWFNQWLPVVWWRGGERSSQVISGDSTSGVWPSQGPDNPGHPDNLMDLERKISPILLQPSSIPYPFPTESPLLLPWKPYLVLYHVAVQNVSRC